MRKITGFVLACVLTAVVTAGCSGNGTSVRLETSSGASALEEEEQLEDESTLSQRWPVGTDKDPYILSGSAELEKEKKGGPIHVPAVSIQEFPTINGSTATLPLSCALVPPVHGSG